jgi:hypothetical protein
VNLTTLESVARLLEVDPAGMEAETKAQIEAGIAEVSARAGGFCNRAFERQERVSYHHGGGRYLYLNEVPVQTIKEILYSVSWEWEGATVYAPSDYALLSPASGLVGFKWIYWPSGQYALRVTYTGGFDPSPAEGQNLPDGYVPIPSDLEAAVSRQVAYEWRRRNDLGIRSVSLPDGTINKMDVGEWLESVEKTLKRYRMRPG